MANDSKNKAPVTIWLTRAEAARYVGVSGESAIRAAEEKGLEAVCDANGQFRHQSTSLDAWKWRGTPPSAAQKARVLRDAQKARQKEARERKRQQQAEEQRQLAEMEAFYQQQQAEMEAYFRQQEEERELRAAVRKKADERRTAFEFTHMNQRMAGEALGFKSYEAREKLRELVNRGLLRRVESPREPAVETSPDGIAREVESTWPLCSGGPFYLHEDVMALANANLQHAPAQVSKPAPEIPIGGIIVAALLVAAIKKARPTSTGHSDSQSTKD